MNLRRTLPCWVEDRLIPSLDGFAGYALERRRVRKFIGYIPNVRNPRSFNEKILWKKINDRDPLLPVVADKVRVADYVRRVLGDQAAAEILIPTLHVVEDPGDIPFDDLPDECVIKANHGSGTNLILRRAARDDRERIMAACRRWLGMSFGLRMHEWHYSRIPRRILVQPFLHDDSGGIPKDFKLFFFHGRFRMLQVDFDRFGDHKRLMFDENMDRLPVEYIYSEASDLVGLGNMGSMIGAGEKLSRDFDFMRVDFFSIGDRVYFGEMTVFPESGRGMFRPREFDYQLGGYWNLRRDYWKDRPLVREDGTVEG